MALVNLRIALRQLDEAQKLAKTLIEDSPRDLDLLVLALEVALARQDFAAAARLEDELAKTQSADDFERRYYHARRLIGQFQQLGSQARSELNSLIDSLQSERPDSAQVAALVGDYATIIGDKREAIDSYRLAIDLGEQRPEVFERLIAALNAEGKHKDAIIYQGRRVAVQPVSGAYDTDEIATAVRDKRFGLALDLAEQAIDRGSTNPMHYVWLANLLSQNGTNKNAEKVFRDAIRMFPNDHRLWNALFNYLVRTNQSNRARRTLATWVLPIGDSKRFTKRRSQTSSCQIDVIE
jgi:tetratricopeptide (TPR) repeat protein